MNRLRIIKTALVATIVAFTVAGAGVSFAVFERQQALREVARYDVVWAVSQAVNEFYRFEGRVAAYGEAGVDAAEVQLRFDILASRLGVLRGGAVRDFTDAVPEQRVAVAAFARLLGEIEPLVQTIDRPGAAQRLLPLLTPVEGNLARLAAAAHEYGGERVAADQRYLMDLHWAFSAIAAGLMLCGLAFIALLFGQNRLVAGAHAELRGMADALAAAKSEAEAASEAKSRFLGNMSHELRTPLNAVIGFGQVIADELYGPVGRPAYRDYARNIVRSGRHMLELVGDILTMARLDAGRYLLSLAAVDTREAVDSAIAIFRGTKQAEDRVLAIGPETAWPWIEADARALRQMVLNLLSNAAKFSDADTPIEIWCRTSAEGEVVLTVADRGIGMTAQEAVEVVRPFQQAESSPLARKYEGSGLGLSIVNGLVGCHGGRLLIESEPGAGSAISLIFPRAVQQQPAADADIARVA